MNQFYTRKGDDGYTGLLGEVRVPKHHPRMEAIGAIDEATAALGLARSLCKTPQSQEILLQIQRDLYHLMAETAATPENAAQFRKIDAVSVQWLEEKTRSLSEGLKIPQEFIVPGDVTASAAIALARTIVRRAERHISRLTSEGELENKELLRYLNRLSSLCFVLEILESSSAGKSSPTLAKG